MTLKFEGVGGQKSESGKSVETSSEAISSAAEGAVRGLQVLGFDQQGGQGDSLLTIVLGWTPANAAMAGQAGAINEAEYQAPNAGSGLNSGVPAPAGGLPTTTIPAKTIVSGAAADFL